MTRVVVTGGSGKVGRACVADLLAHGYEVVNVDTVPLAAENCPFVQADLTDFGQALEILSEVDDRLRDIDAEAKRILLSYAGLEATVEEVSTILREEVAAA